MDTRQYFNQRARAWDRQQLADPGKIHTMLLLSGMQQGDRVLDVGCGTGVLEPYLLREGAGKIWAVDFAANMVETARAKCSHPAVEYRCADILEVSGIQCDSCFIYNTYPHFAGPEEVLAHLAGLIRPGGRITISHPSGTRGVLAWSKSPTGGGVAKLMQDSSFFRLDTVVDSPVMFLVSGERIDD